MSKKAICFLAVLIFSIYLYAQKGYFVDQGKINFTSEAPLEIIKASSDKLKGFIDPSNNQFSFIVYVQTFKGFNTGLQQEHFNEKYMESEVYPTASFKGKIIELINFSIDGEHEVRAKGDLEIHGQKQTRIIKGKLVIRNGVITIDSDFKVPLADHNIVIPHIISEKIATEIMVSIHASMKAQ